MARTIVVKTVSIVEINEQMLKEMWSGDPEVLQKRLDVFARVSNQNDLFHDNPDKGLTEVEELRLFLETISELVDYDEEVEFVVKR